MLVQPLAPRIPRAAPTRAVAWLPWTVVERANGCFHVSRESGGGTQREFLNNTVGRLAIFRKRATADAACAQLRDTQAGMDWWDALSEDDRRFWFSAAITATPALAWAYYKRTAREAA